jgi:hypothetical protein
MIRRASSNRPVVYLGELERWWEVYVMMALGVLTITGSERLSWAVEGHVKTHYSGKYCPIALTL